MATKNKPVERERDIQKGIMDFLAYKRIFHYRNNSGAVAIQPVNGPRRFLRAGALGSPDIVAVVGGKYIGIEVKRPGGALRASQWQFKQQLETAGGLYWVFDSVDEFVDHMESYLKANG